MTPTARPTHLVLVGMMGVGKSTVGRRVAKILERPFRDSDDEIVARTGRSVADIFATDGEARFREIEADVMAELLSADRPSVIAAAGGSILSESTRSLLRSTARVVWMRAPIDLLVGRTSRGTHRPALADDPRGTLERMEADRTDLYAGSADVVVDCARPKREVIEAVVAAAPEVMAR